MKEKSPIERVFEPMKCEKTELEKYYEKNGRHVWFNCRKLGHSARLWDRADDYFGGGT